MTWQRAFDDPIPLPNGKTIVTFEQAARYIQKLPKAKQTSAEGETATEALIMAAEDRGPPMHAHIAMMQALNHGKERVFSDQKDQKWGKRKLLRDQ